MLKRILTCIYLLPFLLISIHSTLADTLDDLQISTELASEFNAGNLILAERLLNDLKDPNLNMIWTSNIIGKYYEIDDLKSVVRLLPNLKDPNLNQIWISNVLLKAMTLKQCDIGKPLIPKLEDENLQKIWFTNYKLGC
jgi:hypothetical protein